MLTSIFKRVCHNLQEISKMDENNRQTNLQLFMSQGYLFLDLTDKQVDKLKTVLKDSYPDIYKEYNKPDNNGFTGEFMYLRFK